MFQKTIYLDFYNHNINSLRVKQNDAGRTVEVVCTDSGKKYFLDETAVRAYILFNKKDGTFSFKEGTITKDGTVLIEFTSPMTSVVGKQSMEILIVKSEGLNVENLSGVACYEDFGANVVSTMPFYVTVVGSVIDSSEITSLSEFDALTNALMRLSETEGHMRDLDTLLKKNDAEREQKETVRQTKFEANESARATTFTTNETTRQSTFVANEATRQSDFDANEATRDTTFKKSESDRTASFNAKIAEYDERMNTQINGENGYTAQVNAVITECSDNEDEREKEFDETIQKVETKFQELNNLMGESTDDATKDTLYGVKAAATEVSNNAQAVIDILGNEDDDASKNTLYGTLKGMQDATGDAIGAAESASSAASSANTAASNAQNIVDTKMDKENPTGTGSFSLNRLSDSIVGDYSSVLGKDCEASGKGSSAEGFGTISAGDYQHVQGQFNIEDTENRYAHIIGNGTGNYSQSNAHTIDWDGNSWFAGDVRVGGDSYNNGENLITESEVNDKITNLKKADVVLVSGNNGTGYSTKIGGDISRCYVDLGLVVLTGCAVVTLTEQITAGTSIDIVIVSNYKPFVDTPLAIWQNSTQNRRYMGKLDTNGILTIKSNDSMVAGEYYIYYQAAYIATEYFLTEKL